MNNFKKEYVIVGSLIAKAICIGSIKLTASQPARSTAVSTLSHDPFMESSSDSSDDNNLHIGPISIPIPSIMDIFGGSSNSSPEQDAEDDVLADTAMNIALPNHLISHMADIKPFLKILVRNKRSSPRREEQDVLGVLRRANSHKVLLSTDKYIPSDIPENTQELPTFVSSAFKSDNSLVDNSLVNESQAERVIQHDIQRERIKIQQLLLEASKAALDAKEEELEVRARIILRKEEKLKQKLSKKYAAGVAGIASILTTIIGTLTAYYSSK
jgi:hypothetical protein